MKTILVGFASMIGAFSFATTPIEVTNFESTSTCGTMSHEINTDPNDSSIQCLRVYFGEFSVVSGRNASGQRNCHMKATLRIPANTQFRASEAVAEGVYNIVGEAFAGLALSYQLKSINSFSSWLEVFHPNTQGDFTFTTKMADEIFTPCIGYETEIDLVSDLHAFIDQRSGDSSLISLDETGKRLSWNWKIQPCEADLFIKPFITYYSAPNGRRYRATMAISGNRGTYTSQAGFTGQLSNLRRSGEGRILEGDWSAQGVRGQLRFVVSNPRTGEFNGSWTDNQGHRGTWTGYYE